MAVSLGMATVAVVWGIITGARIVLFDGVYLLLGIGLSWFSLRVSKTVEAGPTARYPFGRESLTPFAIAIQGLALVGTLVYAAADAVVIIREGGSEVAPLAVAGYGFITAAIGIAVTILLPKLAKGSELIEAEASQWKAGAGLSVVMTVGAVAALMLANVPSLSGIIRYIDPILVLVAVLLLAPVPIKLLRTGFGELLEAAPPADIQAAVHNILAEVQLSFGLDDPIVRMHKIGKRLYLEADFVVLAGEWDVSEEDKVRRAIISRVETLGYDLWANVELTTDRDLAI
nr:cation transporter [Lysinibacter cavernae]